VVPHVYRASGMVAQAQCLDLCLSANDICGVQPLGGGVQPLGGGVGIIFATAMLANEPLMFFCRFQLRTSMGLKNLPVQIEINALSHMQYR